MLDALLHDLRHAARHLQRSPGFSAAAILTLALGIGANTAMLAVLNVLVLRQLPVKDPHNLIAASSWNDNNQRMLTMITAVTELEREGPFESVCAINGGGQFATEVNRSPTQSVIALVTGDCFDVFGVAPLLGRVITDNDAPIDAPGQLVTVISHGFWRRAFGGDPHVIGKTMRMEGIELNIIGVMPPRFGGLQADNGIDVFVPNYTILPQRADRPSGASHIVGRLKPGIAFEQAAAELSGRWPSLLAAIVPATVSGPERAQFLSARVRVERMTYGIWSLRERYARPVMIVFGLTATLLLLACVNLGGLLLARAAERTNEIITRRALGATPGRLVQQTLLESLIVAGAGALVAIPVSFVFVDVLVAYLPPSTVERVTFAPDIRVMAATAISAIAAGVMISFVPMRLLWRRDALAFGWGRTIAGATGRWSRGLLVAQVALSIVLLSGAALLGRSLYLLHQIDRGIRTDGVLNIAIRPLPDAYRSIDNATYYPALLEQVRSLPGVRGAGMARLFPRLSFTVAGAPIRIIGEPDRDVRAQLEAASPGLFEALEVPLIAGRLPAWTDRESTQQVAVVSESLARQLDPSGDVVGRRVAYGAARADQDVVIVGVVANMSLGNPRQSACPVFYRPTLQTGRFGNFPSVIVAADVDPLAIVGAINAILKNAGREYAYDVRLLEDVFIEAPAAERMSATLAGAVAILAVTLAFIGIYGVLVYSVSRRRREIGVRVALGASRRCVMGMVMREGMMLTAIGMVIGIPAAIAAARVLRTLLFGITETDPLVLASTGAFFVILGFTAGLVPAFRAAAVDPAIALRTE